MTPIGSSPGGGKGRPPDPRLGRILQAAVGHASAGQFDAALTALESNGRIALSHPLGQNVLGGIYLRQGRKAEAIKAFDAAIRAAPNLAEAHCNRGVALHDSGRLKEALAALDKALTLRRPFPLAEFNRGNTLRELGRLKEAVEAYTRALAGQAAFPEASLNRGLVRLDIGQAELALADFDRAIGHGPVKREAQRGRAAALEKLGRLEAALSAADALLADDPADAEVLSVKAAALEGLERDDEARACLERIAASTLTGSKDIAFRGAALAKLERWEEALAVGEALLALDGKDADGYLLKARAYRGLHRFEEQLAALDAAKALAPERKEIDHYRGLALADLTRDAESIVVFEEAIARDPNNATLHHDLALSLLATGDFERGWREYEWRIDLPGHRKLKPLDRLAPRWTGDDIAGRRLLIYGEQGRGDVIQFMRYLPAVKARGAAVTLVLPAGLQRLFRPLTEGMDVVAAAPQAGHFDRQAALMSLPFILGTRLHTIPADGPYVAAEPALVEKWRGRLGEAGSRIGICWQGNPAYCGDTLRSVPLRAFAALGRIPGVRLISLQAVNGLDQLRTLPEGMTVETLGDEIVGVESGFAETAAVMANLDLIVTSDTAMAHLAGAMGRPTYVALSARPDWRWLRGRSDCPWYPTMRLFRQATRDDWGPVFAEIAAAVTRQLAKAPAA